MTLISLIYIVMALCIFKTLHVFRMYSELGRMRNWEIAVMIFISAFWLPELVIFVITFALFGPMLWAFRYLRRVKSHCMMQ